MPLYLFEHPITQARIEVYFKMNDDKKYIDEAGVEWSRVWQAFNFSVDSKINPWSPADFIEKTGAKKGTVGDLWDKSAELSKQRAKENGGIDPVKQKFFKSYKKKRKGVKHPDDKETKR